MIVDHLPPITPAGDIRDIDARLGLLAGVEAGPNAEEAERLRVARATPNPKRSAPARSRAHV